MPDDSVLRPLGAELRWMRQAAGCSGPALATRLGVSQPQVSRWETARRRPSVDEVLAWLAVCEQAARGRLDDDSLSVRQNREIGEAVERMVSEAYRTTLIRLAEDAATEVVSNYVVYRTGMAERQQQLVDLDARSARIRHFQPLIVPGPLQTAEYARLVMLGFGVSEAEAAAAAQTRMERGRRLRETPVPAYHAIVAESALDLVLAGSTASLRREVLRNIAELADLSHVTAQVVPRFAPWVHVPVGGFVIHDLVGGAEPVALVETYAAQVTFTAPGDLERHDLAWKQLESVALDPTQTNTWLVQTLDASQ